MWMAVAVSFTAAFVVSEWMVQDRIARTLIRLYLGWWFICLFASTLDPMDIYPVSPFAYFILLLNVGALTAGFIFAGRGTEPVVDPDTYRPLARSFDEEVVRSRGVLLVLVGFALYLLDYFLRFLVALAEVGPFEGRIIRFGVGPVFGSAPELLVYNTFAEGLAVALVVIVAYALVLGSVRNWVFFWALVDLALFAGIGAGRTMIVQAGVFIAVLAILRSTLQPRSQRKSLLAYVVAPGLLLATVMFFLTLTRLFALETGLELLQDGDVLAVAGEALLDNVWNYSIGPFRALDYALSHPSLFGFQFGRLTFGAVDELIGYPLRMLGFDYRIMNHVVGTTTQDVIFIGSSDFNALYTAVFRFYYDFGVPGVAVLSFLFGVVLRGAVLWFQATPSAATLSILLFLFSAAVLSMQTWHLASPGAVVFLAGAILFQRARDRGRLGPSAMEGVPADGGGSTRPE